MFDFSVLFDAWRMFLDGLLLTLLLMTIGCSLGTVLGTACAWGSVEGPRWLRLVIQVYVEIFRNTPFIIQLFFIFFGLASINLRMGAVAASIFALSINLGDFGDSSRPNRSGAITVFKPIPSIYLCCYATGTGSGLASPCQSVNHHDACNIRLQPSISRRTVLCRQPHLKQDF